METQLMIDKIQAYLATQPVLKAWLFGSYARGEQTLESDVDILVALDKTAHIGLFGFTQIYLDLQDLLNKEVDLVEEGTLKSYAVPFVEKDKILIYERTN